MNVQKASIQNKQAFGNVVVLEPANSENLTIFNSLRDQVFNSPFRTDIFQYKDGPKMLVSDGNEKVALDSADEAFRKVYLSTYNRGAYTPMIEHLLDLTRQFAESAKTVKVSSLDDVLFIKGFQDLVRYMRK